MIQVSGGVHLFYCGWCMFKHMVLTEKRQPLQDLSDESRPFTSHWSFNSRKVALRICSHVLSFVPTSCAAGQALLLLSLVEQQVGWLLPPLTHSLTSRLCDSFVIEGEPTVCHVTLVGLMVNTFTDVMAWREETHLLASLWSRLTPYEVCDWYVIKRTTIGFFANMADDAHKWVVNLEKDKVSNKICLSKWDFSELGIIFTSAVLFDPRLTTISLDKLMGMLSFRAFLKHVNPNLRSWRINTLKTIKE